MDKQSIFAKLSAGVSDLAQFYLEDGTDESRSILEDFIKNLQDIGAKLQIQVPAMNNEPLKEKIQELCRVAAGQLQTSPTVKNFQFLDKLVKTLRTL